MQRFYETARDDERRKPRIERPASPYRYVRWRWRALFTLIDAVGWSMARVLQSIARWRGKAGVAPAAEPRSILIVQLDHLGDAVISTVLLRELKARYPQARIDVLAAPWNREIFAGCPEVGTVQISATNRFSRSSRLGWPLAVVWWGWKMRRERYDLGIDVRGEIPSVVLLWLAGVKRRLGWSCGGGGFLLTDRARYVAKRNEVDSRFALLDVLGERAGPEQSAAPSWEPDAEAREQIRERVAVLSESDRPVLVFHISAGTPAKRWPAENWRELLGRVVLEVDGAMIVLVGSQADRAIAGTVLGGQAWPNVFDWVGQLSVFELAALCERADLFVGADSGPAHLATAVGTPAVVLFSGTNDPQIWQPRGGHVTVLKHHVACSPCHRESCLWADHPCLNGLQPAVVMSAIQTQLRAGKIRSFNTVGLPILTESTT